MLLAVRWADSSVLLLVGAAVGWYAASMVTVDALAGAKLAIRRRTLGHWLPILCTGVVAILLHRPEVAVGVIFATSVAALSLVLGIVTCTHHFSSPSTAAGGFPVIDPHNPIEAGATSSVTSPLITSAPDTRRLWAFVLPAALITLLAGFKGQLTLTHAVILLIQGLAVLFVWRGQPEIPSDLAADHRALGMGKRAFEFILAIGLAVLASLAGGTAAAEISRTLGLVSGGFVAAMMLSPALVLSMIGSGMNIARAGFYHAAVTMSVGLVLLNLCIALPLVIGLWYATPMWQKHVDRIVTIASNAGSSLTATAPATEAASPDLTAPASPNAALSPPPLRFPLPVWRIDTVVLILLGLVLLPLSIGRWMPGRFEGLLMILVYVVYMGLTTIAARA